MQNMNWERILLSVLAAIAGALAAAPPPVLVPWQPALVALAALLVGKEFTKSSVQKRDEKARASRAPKAPKPPAAAIAILLCLTPIAAFQQACGASLATILATVPGVVDTVLRVVDEIVDFVAPQLSESDRAKLDEYVKAINDTAALLKAAADGTKSVTEGDVTAAFDRLEDLYKRIVDFTRKYGVTYAADGRMSASPERLAVPKYEDIKR